MVAHGPFRQIGQQIATSLNIRSQGAYLVHMQWADTVLEEAIPRNNVARAGSNETVSPVEITHKEFWSGHRAEVSTRCRVAGNRGC
jgi:hypothetical protein